MRNTILAISGSLRDASFTEKILDACIEGMGDNLDVHKFYPHRMNIGPCTGCGQCRHPERAGICIQMDDFRQILDVYKKSHYVLIAAPLYVSGFPATVKNVIDRFSVLLDSCVENINGAARLKIRLEHNPRAVLISSCGYPEQHSFFLLKEHFQCICKHFGWIYAGDLCVAASGIYSVPGVFEKKHNLIRLAGKKLLQGRIPEKISTAIAAPVVSEEEYRSMITFI